jgi:hypothetical protein
MKPSEETIKLEFSSQSFQTDILARKTTTTTTKKTIAGIPYCTECSGRSTRMKKDIGRSIWISILLSVAAAIIIGSIAGTDSSFVVLVVVLCLMIFGIARLVLRIKYPDIRKNGLMANKSLGINLTGSEEEKHIDGFGVYVTFFNIEYAKLFIGANLPEGDQQVTSSS